MIDIIMILKSFGSGGGVIRPELFLLHELQLDSRTAWDIKDGPGAGVIFDARTISAPLRSALNARPLDGQGPTPVSYQSTTTRRPKHSPNDTLLLRPPSLRRLISHSSVPAHVLAVMK